MVEEQRQFVYVLEQTGMTTAELGKNLHMHARFYVKDKGIDVSPGKVANLEVWRITKLDKNSTNIVNIDSLTTYTSSLHTWLVTRTLKSILTIKCEMDVDYSESMQNT